MVRFYVALSLLVGGLIWRACFHVDAAITNAIAQVR